MDKTKIAVDVFNLRAVGYQEKYMDVSLYHNTLDIFLDNIHKPDAEILELACGPGNITRYMLDKRPSLKILATDLAPNMLELAMANNPGAVFQLLDCRNIAGINKKFDAIMCGFCLPYLSKEDTIQLINDASQLLLPGGILYLSTMEGDYSTSAWQTSSSGDKLFQYYHEAGYLTQALEHNGFNIIYLHRQEYPANTGSKVIDLIIIAQK